MVVARGTKNEPLFPGGDDAANRRAVSLRKPNVAVREQFDYDFARTDCCMEVSDPRPRMVAGNRLKSNLSEPSTSHPADSITQALVLGNG
ncbi:MAG: hypothetical protein M3R30_08635, partial [Candidatus Eremiobacteraeota bacterium]|nr:hypothetical protein [Candidatus Eremiobacteraeota bacterium]